MSFSVQSLLNSTGEDLVSNWQRQAQAFYADRNMASVARWLAQSFTGEQPQRPRAASNFTTQQKWLLTHLAACLYALEATGRTGSFSAQTFVKVAVQQGVASRNTARDFFLEIIKYDFSTPEKKSTPLDDLAAAPASVHPTPQALMNMQLWYQLHLGALDMLDGRDRSAVLAKDPLQFMLSMQPLVAEGLLACPDIRAPGPIYALFSWVDEGGLLMDRLISGVDPAADAEAEKIPTDVVSVAELARGLNVSRVHAARVISRAEETGALGWTGTRGRSLMWIARALREEYTYFQAMKLAIIDSSFSATVNRLMPEDEGFRPQPA